MATIILTGDGQSFPIEDEIARDDELLKSVVKSVSPAYADPIFRRETKGDSLTVHVSKQAKTKGAGAYAIEVLTAAPSGTGPVEAMRERLDRLQRGRRLNVEKALSMDGEVREAIAAGLAERQILRHAIKVLLSCESVPASFVPVGF